MGFPKGMYRGKDSPNYGKRYVTRSEVNPELKKISPEQVAWVAGIIEGEGSFIVEKRRSGAYATRVYASARIQANMTDQDVIERLAELMGGKINLERQKDPNRKDQWRWTLRGYETVRTACTLLRPWMFERRIRQMDHMFAVVDAVREEVLNGRS